MPNTEKNEIANLNELRGLIVQVNNELMSLRGADSESIKHVASIEAKVNEVVESVNDLSAKYMVFKSEDRKGQWGLCALLLTTLLGWVANFISWLVG